jgi:hypothetical protein
MSSNPTAPSYEFHFGDNHLFSISKGSPALQFSNGVMQVSEQNRDFHYSDLAVSHTRDTFGARSALAGGASAPLTSEHPRKTV